MAVVIPVHRDTVEPLIRCLKAVQVQAAPLGAQVVVVDDGCPTPLSTVDLPGEPRLVRHRVRRGAAAARETGVSAAGAAAVVAFLDDDAEPTPGWLEGLVTPILRGEAVASTGPVLPSSVVTCAERHAAVRRANSPQPDQRGRAPITGGGNSAFSTYALIASGALDSPWARLGRAGLATAGFEDGFLGEQVCMVGEVAFVPTAVVRHDHRRTIRGRLRQYAGWGGGAAVAAAASGANRPIRCGYASWLPGERPNWDLLQKRFCWHMRRQRAYRNARVPRAGAALFAAIDLFEDIAFNVGAARMRRTLEKVDYQVGQSAQSVVVSRPHSSP